MADCDPVPVRLHRLHPVESARDYTEARSDNGYPLALKWCREHERPHELCEIEEPSFVRRAARALAKFAGVEHPGFNGGEESG